MLRFRVLLLDLMNLTKGCAHRSLAIVAVNIAALSASGITDMNAQQVTAPDFFYLQAQQYSVDIFLDTIGIVPRLGVTADEAESALAQEGVTFGRALPAGLFLFGLAQPLLRDEIDSLARRLEDDHPAIVSQAGLVMLAPGIQNPITATDLFIVQFQPNASSVQIDSLNAEHEVEIVARTPLADNHFLLRVTEQSGGDAITVANIYHESVVTVYAHPDFLGVAEPASVIPDDTFFAYQWHLYKSNSDQGHINAPGAWDVTMGDADIVIAIIEVNGYDTTNVDLSQSLWENAADPPGDQDNDGNHDDDDNGYIDDIRGWHFTNCVDPTMGQNPQYFGPPGCGTADIVSSRTGHGSAVAGLAAARGDNDTGVSGVCPNCKLMLLELGVGTYAIARAFAYAWQMGADVINVSTKIPASFADVAAQVALAASEGRGNGRGSVVVYAMGNDDFDACSDIPGLATLSDVIGVGASTDQDTRASYSNHGNCLDVLAPGSVAGSTHGLVTTDDTGPDGYNDTSHPADCPKVDGNDDLPDNSFTACFGQTSGATPIVSGIAGLILSANPCLTTQEVQGIVSSTAVDITGEPVEHQGAGRVDAHGAVQAAIAIAGDCEIVVADSEGGVEVGVRLGIVAISAGEDQVIAGVPGGGPMGRPVVYIDWFLASSAMLELQIGSVRTWNSGNIPDESSVGAVFQPTFLVSPGLYLGPNIAFDYQSIGSASNTEWGYGAAIGYRYKPQQFLALRLEVLFRRWSSLDVDEVGLALGAGIVF